MLALSLSLSPKEICIVSYVNATTANGTLKLIDRSTVRASCHVSACV